MQSSAAGWMPRRKVEVSEFGVQMNFTASGDLNPEIWALRSKNVTIKSLHGTSAALHIVFPAEWLRYYLLFTGIHRLLALAVHRY
jgi:hypothetical protein